MLRILLPIVLSILIMRTTLVSGDAASEPFPAWSADGTHIAFLRHQSERYVIERINADGSDPSLLVSSTSSRAVWSPDSSKIAYIELVFDGFVNHLQIINADGSQKRTLISRLSLYNPSWSPDGSKIMFGSNGDIFVIDPDGTNLTLLLSGDVGGEWPVWSPSGKQIAYYRSSAQAIWVMDSDGGNSRQLIERTVPGYQSSMAWSPDGQKVAFVYTESPAGGQPNDEIGLVDVVNGEFINLTNNPANDHEVSWASDSSKIAFSRAGDIYVTGADGSGQSNNLTPGGGDDRLPVWSPLDDQIAFISMRDGQDEVYVMGSDGVATRLTYGTRMKGEIVWSPNGNEMLLLEYQFPWQELQLVRASGGTTSTPLPTMNTSFFDWSPAGQQIAFLIKQSPTSYELYRANADGSGVAKVIVEGSVGSYTWSPDGQQIAFILVNQSPSETRLELYRVNADGSNPLKLSQELFVDTYAWSPDGQKLAFTVPRGSSKDLYLVEASGNHLTKLLTTTPGNRATAPTWSPDGRRIALSTGTIFVIDAESGSTTNSTSGLYNAGDPVWSPDGQHIAFFGSSASGEVEIFVMEPDGGVPVQITNEKGVESSGITWSPDSSQIAYVRGQITYIYQKPPLPPIPYTTYSVCLVKIDGSVHKVLTNNAIVPKWSPDGRYLLFQNDSSNLALVDAGGNNVVDLGVVPNSSWSWGPDAKRILYSTAQGIYILDIPNLP